MDDIYEFKNNEYRLACMQIKATAYDIVTGIMRKKTANLDELFKIRDRIVELTDSFERELEKLDAEEESVKQQTSGDEKAQELAQQPTEKKEDDLNLSINNIELPSAESMSKKEKKQETGLEESNVTPIEQSMDSQTSSGSVELTPITPTKDKPGQQQNDVEQKPETTPLAKKKFKKTTKQVSKAIMVRPNQLANLRNSRQFQEQILAKQGIFAIAERIQQQQLINKNSKELPDEVERKIEDLTVKANVYYNEGEIEKAQELYDKIRELNNQYQ